MLLKRKEIWSLYNSLGNISIKDKYLMYLFAKNKEILKPEGLGITEYLKTGIDKYKEYEEKYSEMVKKYIDKEDHTKVDPSKIIEYYIENLELKIKYYNVLELRDKEALDAEPFLEESVNVNIDLVDYNKLDNVSISVLNNISIMVKSDLNIQNFNIKNIDCLNFRNFLNSCSLELSNKLKYQFSYNYSILSSIANKLESIKKISDIKNDEYNLKKYQIYSSYAKRDDNGLIIFNGFNVKIKEELNNEYLEKIKELDEEYSDVLLNIEKNNKKIEEFLEQNVNVSLFGINNDDIPEDFDQDNYEKIFPIIL